METALSWPSFLTMTEKAMLMYIRRIKLMKITKKQNGTTLEMAVEGRVDTLTAPDLAEELKASLEGMDNLVLDFAQVEYISSAGLRALLMAYKMLYGKGSVRVINNNDITKAVFKVTGLNKTLIIE